MSKYKRKNLSDEERREQKREASRCAQLVRHEHKFYTWTSEEAIIAAMKSNIVRKIRSWLRNGKKMKRYSKKGRKDAGSRA